MVLPSEMPKALRLPPSDPEHTAGRAALELCPASPAVSEPAQQSGSLSA